MFRWSIAATWRRTCWCSQRLQELSEARVLPPRMFGGLRDTLRVLLDVARGTGGRWSAPTCCARSNARSKISIKLPRRWAPPTPCCRG
jgi:hypothetical protein